MKTKRKVSMNNTFKWLAIFPVIVLIIAVIPSCKGKTKPSESKTEQIASSHGDTDSTVVLGQKVPADAPPPPAPGPPEPFNVANGDTVWFRVDEFPVYPGGADALSKFIAESFTYPESAKKKKIQGRVVVGFVLTKECKVTNAKIVTGISPDCDQEALRVVNSLPLFQKPAMVKGRPVAYHFTLPVHYALK